MSSAWKRFKARLAPADDSRVDWLLSAPFVAIHLSLLAIPWLGFGAREAGAAALTYGLGMFFVTAGYHRYFSHRAFRTGRAFQLVLAVGAQATVQRGVLWWSGHHRGHHRNSDGPGDPHSPRLGLFWSHVGWFLGDRHEEAHTERVKDLARFPELVWLERWYWVPPAAIAAVLLAAGGPRLAVGGYALGLVALWHATFTINSLAHRFGTRRFETGDDSRNNAWLALLTFGEGWHNNHHFFPSAARQGFAPREIDVTYGVLLVLERLGVVRDLRAVPARVLAAAGPERRRPPLRSLRSGTLALALALALPVRAAERFGGTARDEAGNVVYLEEHEERRDGDRLVFARTRYLSPDGTLLATLDSDFSKNPHAPDYEFRDLVYGEREAVRILGGRIELFAAERARVVNAPRDLPVVAGQGLHHLLRDRLDDLVRGDALRVAFALPSRQDWYEFRVRAVRSPDPSVVRLRVDLASWVLRLLAPSLEVDYDLETRRLLRYRGVSNLPGPGGAPRTVEIRYAHPEETRAPAY